MNKYYNFSCEEIFLCLMQLMNQFEGFQADSDFKKNFDIYILFALSEFTLFSTYDQVTLTCACIMLEFRSSKDEKTMNSFLRVLCELNLNENDVLSCLSSITNELSLNETETETSKKKFKKFKKRKQ